MLLPALAVALIAAAGTGQVPRDTTAKPEARAVVKGRVTSAATGQPLHRVRITLNGPLTNPPTTVTDTDGAFEVTDVPAGSYTITAQRAGYLTRQYGQHRPRQAGRTITVKPGETLEDLQLSLPKGGVLAGRVTDELGDPSPGTRVEAIELRYLHGRRVPVAARIATTNDAGEYRLSGLEPGAYQVRASTTDVWEGEEGKGAFVHSVTYYPGVTAAEQPQRIDLSSGHEVPGVDIRLIAGTAARVTGVVEDASGQPLASQLVHLDRAARTIGGALWYLQGAGSTKTDERGAFEFPTLAPGEYVAYSGGQAERVSAAVTVGDGGSAQVVLRPSRPTGIVGKIVSDDGSPLPFPASRVRVSSISADAQNTLPSFTDPPARPVRPDGTFRISDLDGPYLFRVDGLPDAWMLKAVLLGERDITDAPISVKRGAPDLEGLQIVLSGRGARLTGHVVDRDGAPAADSTVIVFADDPAQWRVGSRFLKAVRPGDSGRFAVGGLPPGAFRVIARDFVVDGQWEDPDFLQSLVREAVRVNLAEAATETIELTLTVEQVR